MPTNDPSPEPGAGGHREAVRQIIREHYDRGDTTGWFEALYAWAGEDAQKIPWADRRPNRNLSAWLEREQVRGAARSACVVGCGLGDDAELLARYGFKVTAFDLSASAIAWCRRRYPRSSVRYEQADLLDVPAAWRGHFDFTFEAYTVQALPHSLRRQAIEAVAGLVCPGGAELLVITRGRDPSDDPGDLPWPLTADELSWFDAAGLRRTASEDFWDNEDPPVRRFRATFRRE